MQPAIILRRQYLHSAVHGNLTIPVTRTTTTTATTTTTTITAAAATTTLLLWPYRSSDTHNYNYSYYYNNYYYCCCRYYTAIMTLPFQWHAQLQLQLLLQQLLLLLLLLLHCYYDLTVPVTRTTTTTATTTTTTITAAAATTLLLWPCRSSDTHNPLRSSQLRRRWTVHMELAAGTATQLSTIILVPAWTKNWTVCQSISSLAHSWLFLNCKSGRTLTSLIHHHHHHSNSKLLQNRRSNCESCAIVAML